MNRPTIIVVMFCAAFATLAVGFVMLRAGSVADLGVSTHLNELHAEVFFLNVPDIVRRGPPRLVVVRLEDSAKLIPYHFASLKLSNPLTIEDWAQKLGAPIVINSGQFDEKLQYIGWLKSRGQWLAEQRKSAWMGLLVSDPVDQGAYR
jgi:hypothetical protein